MKIEVNGQTINLSKTDFLSQGGEGSVYVRGNTAYKIYHSQDKMIPIAKINELSGLDLQRIIKPHYIIYNNNIPIGYTMRYVENTYPLCKVFTKAFKQRNNLSFENVFKLAKTIQDGVEHIHNKRILIVDLNELNFLISEHFDDVFFIDVDSYQTKSFPATAIMESIRDRHSKKFSELSDWFSWAVVTFQMLIGIHPYKGRHSSITDLEERMLKNISVFNKDVSVPKICESFDLIPEVYRNWYKAIFEDGKRLPPPTSMQAVAFIAPIIKSIIGSNLFDIEELFKANEDIISVFYGQNRYVTTTSKIICNNGNHLSFPINSHLAVTTKDEYFVWPDNGKIIIQNKLTGNKIEIIGSNKLMSRDGRVYIQEYDSVCELAIKETTNNKFMCFINVVANILPQATQMFNGVILQNILGTWFASIPNATGSCIQTQLKELNGYRIIDAKSEKNVLMVIGFANGSYKKFIYCFDSNFDKYDLCTEENINNLNVNFTVLDNNICVHLNDKDELELFAGRCGQSNQKKVIKDSILGQDMRLVSQGTLCQFVRGDSLYSIKVKQKP